MKDPTENNKEKEVPGKKDTALRKAKKKPAEPQGVKGIEQVLTAAAVPREIREQITAFISSESGPSPHPLISKITEEHITKMIDCTDAEGEREHSSRTRIQIFSFIIILLGLGFLVFLITYLSDTQNLLGNILLGLGAFMGGMGTGFGLGKKS